jgi:hypothetical protein
VEKRVQSLVGTGLAATFDQPILSFRWMINTHNSIVMNSVRCALDEICTHQKVAGYKMLDSDELEIRFADETYNDLIIPLTPKMNNEYLLTVFYYYMQNFQGC